MTKKYRTKQGKHGILYLYRVKYQDDWDSDNRGIANYWAYDSEHAIDRFYDVDDDSGWRPIGNPTRATL